jgi:hypothetical protein
MYMCIFRESYVFILARLWACDKPHVIRERGYRIHFRIQVSADTAGDVVVDPYLLYLSGRPIEDDVTFWKLF